MYHEYAIDFVSYNALVTAIPKEWREFFTQNNVYRPTPPSNYDKMMLKPHLSAYVYENLTSNPNKILEKILSWNEELNTSIQAVEFFNHFKNIYRITNVSKF